MSTVKTELLEWVRSLPDDCTWEDLQAYAEIRTKVARGLADIAAGRVVTQDEAERRVEGWLKSSGPKAP